MEAPNPLSDQPPPATRPSEQLRSLSAALGAGRIAIGVGLALAPILTLRALGFRDASPATVTVARIAGGRDIAMGVVTVLALGDVERLRAAHLANAAVDAGDAAAFAAALGMGRSARTAGIRGLAAAAPASVAGAWAALRLS